MGEFKVSPTGWPVPLAVFFRLPLFDFRKRFAVPVKEVFHDFRPFKSRIAEWINNRQTIGVVPTMGALHEGHLSLVRTCLAEADVTIVTIFLNPTQFAPGEDLASYPRTLDSDLAQLSELGDLWVFAPSASEIYPSDFSTSLVPPDVSNRLEGEHRPEHFAGVTTIVLKLFNLTQANIAYFGQKDFQQQLVIKQMVKDLNVPIDIRVCPIVREPDGLALSSRNVYLSDQERTIAQTLNQTLTWAEAEIQEGQRDGYELMVEMRQKLIDGGVTRIDYAAVADPHSLDTVETIQLPVVLLLAATVGTTRLIDNAIVEEA